MVERSAVLLVASLLAGASAEGALRRARRRLPRAFAPRDGMKLSGALEALA